MEDPADSEDIDFRDKSKPEELQCELNEKLYDLLSLLDAKRFVISSDRSPLFGIAVAVRDHSKVRPFDAKFTLSKVASEKLATAFKTQDINTAWQWTSSNRDRDLTMASIRRFAKTDNPDGYKALFSKSSGSDMTPEMSFEKTFESKLIIDRITEMLVCMDMTFNEFKALIIDEKFTQVEFAFWFEKHITPTIKNSMSLNRLGKFRHFEQMIKTILFADYQIAQRFISIFIHEYFLFFVSDSKHCYIKRAPTDDNCNPLESVDMGMFGNIRLKIETDRGVSTPSMKDMLSGIPYHQFEYTSYIWNMEPHNRDAFSMAYPFAITGEGVADQIELDDLPESLVYYLTHIVCNDSADRFDWVRSYLANMIHQPNQQTGVMLILYSMAKRVGKSTLKWLIEQIINASNMHTANHLGEVFGIRGAPGAVGKRLVWFEELSASNKDFREYMDKMKSAITDGVITTRALYKEFQKTRNTNEYIAASNHLVGVLEDRMSVFDFNTDKKGDTAFYGKLRSECTPEVLNKFVAYLKRFTTSLPMKPIHTEIFKTMQSNSAEPIEQYIKDLRESTRQDFHRFNNGSATYVLMCDLYAAYTSWTRETNEKLLSESKFKAKVLHYGSAFNVEKIRVRHYSSRPNVFKFDDDFFVHADQTIAITE
jgi:hypothetical protein